MQILLENPRRRRSRRARRASRRARKLHRRARRSNPFVSLANPRRRSRRSKRRGRRGHARRRSNPFRIGGGMTGGIVGNGKLAVGLYLGQWVGMFTSQVLEKQAKLQGKVPWWGIRLGVGVLLGAALAKFGGPLKWLGKPVMVSGMLDGIAGMVPYQVSPIIVAQKTGLGDFVTTASLGAGGPELLGSYGPTAADYGVLGGYFEQHTYNGIAGR